MTLRPLLAAAVTAAALAAPSADATCHLCFAPVPCSDACDVAYVLLAAVESRSAAGHDLSHTVCVLVRDNTGLNRACED